MCRSSRLITGGLRERRELLSGSQERMASLEGKGPGLATVNAVVVAAALLAVASGWDESTLVGRIILAAAAFYAGFSLLMPLYLVGPLPRAVIHVADLIAVAKSGSPEAGAGSPGCGGRHGERPREPPHS